jgi:APA family basic amino acid/polyamine antiporter
MIGAGVLAGCGPATKAAGTGLLLGLVVAAVIAYYSATASAQLAAAYPTSGGTSTVANGSAPGGVSPPGGDS